MIRVLIMSVFALQLSAKCVCPPELETVWNASKEEENSLDEIASILTPVDSPKEEEVLETQGIEFGESEEE